MRKFLFAAFCAGAVVASAAEVLIGDRSSKPLENGTAWQSNLLSVWFRKLPAGNYYVLCDGILENGAPGGKLYAEAVAGKVKTGIPFPNACYVQQLRIPLKLKSASGSMLRISGIPAVTAPGKIRLSGIRVVPAVMKPGENLIPASGLELLPDGSAPAGGWMVTNNDRKRKRVLKFSRTDDMLRCEANSSFSLSSPLLILPEKSRLKTSVRIRGKAEIRFYLTSGNWKKVAGWKATHTASPVIHTTDENNTYEFVFPASSDDQLYRWRLDVKAAAPVEIGKPFLTPDDSSVSDRKEEKAELIFRDDFIEASPGQQERNIVRKNDLFMGACAEFSRESSLHFPFAEKQKLMSGSLSFWVRFNKDYTFDPSPEGFWRLDKTSCSADLAHARLYFQKKLYCSVPEQMFKGEWHHVVWVWDNSSYRKIYFDGRLVLFRDWMSGPETASGISFGRYGRIPSFQGAIAGVRLYRNALTADEVMKQYVERRPLTPFMLDFSAIAGEKTAFRVGFDNPGTAERTETRSVTVYAPDGKAVAGDTLSVTVPARSYAVREFSFTPEKAGDYRVTMTNSAGDSFSAVLPVVHNIRLSDQPDSGTLKKELITEIDCSAAPLPGRYADDGVCRIGTLNGRKFRETLGKVPNSGFTYRVALKNPGRPHWLEFEYPDDRIRTFYCGISQVSGDSFASPFLDACGVITGDNFPLTKRFQTKGFFFMTAKNKPEIGIMFGSHFNPNGENGPAVSKIRLYELKGHLPTNRLNPDGRKIMIWNEDPTMLSYTWFNQYQWNRATTNYDFWREKYDVMVRYTRYIGWSIWNTLFYDYGGNSAPGDRRLTDSLYSQGHFPPAHLDMLAKTADRERIPYYLSLNHLSGWGTRNLPTGFAMEMGGELLSRDFDHAASRGADAPELFSAENSLAQIRHRAINPIHPEAVRTFRRIFRACVERYQRSPMFQGIDYQASEPLHFSDPRYGYGDYTTSLYREESGSGLPAFSGTDRFGKRYEWLKQHEWERWISWRCRKVTGLVESLVRELNGRKLILRVTLARVAPALKKELEQGRLPDLNRHYREQGLDLAALAKIPNLTVLPDFRPNYSRIRNDRADERTMNFSDELFSLWKIPGIRSLQITQHSNLEMWAGGGHVPTSKGTERRNLISFSTPLPDNAFALENFAWAVAQTDPQMINYGWWGNPEAGAHEEFRRFYRAFSEIPRLPFTPAPGVNDPVFVRQNGSVLYMVNLCAWRCTVKLEGKRSFRLTDSVTGKPENSASVGLDAFELRVFRQDHAVPVVRVVQQIPEPLKQFVESRLATSGTKNPAADRAKKLYDTGRVAAAYYALQHKSLKSDPSRSGFTVRPRFSADGSRLELILKNHSAKNVKGHFSLTSLPDGWEVRQNGKSVALSAGEERRVEFVFSKHRSAPGKLAVFHLSCTVDGVEEVRTIRHLPIIAERWNGLSGSRFQIPETASRHPLPCCSAGMGYSRAANCSADYAVRWGGEGIALNVRVEDRDFLPPPGKTDFWKYDSIVVYFNPGNNAREGVKSYDADDIPFRIALTGGKPVVLAGEPARETDQVKAVIAHRNGITQYELFFPWSLLPGVNPKAEDGCGFSLEVVNRDAGGKRAVFTPHPEHPHQNPFVWGNLIFKP